MPMLRRARIVFLAFAFTLISFYYLANRRNTWNYGYTSYPSLPIDETKHWKKLPDRYPVSSFIPLPTGAVQNIPKVQAKQPAEDATQKQERLGRLRTVRESFEHSWVGYKNHAWLKDELTPISGESRNTFGGWAATLVDALDSLWILGMVDDFELAVGALDEIDFSYTSTKEINVFETTIRYLGGFLAAYDISGGKYPILLKKAEEVGNLLMCCFDTPNRMPIPRWDWRKYASGEPQEAPSKVLISEIGSLSLEFTRLTQLTGDARYYDAIQRVADVFEKGQENTRLPGMWPIAMDAKTPSFKEDTGFTFGAMSDSLYEYFPKQYLLLGGLLKQPKSLYETSIEVAKKHLFFRIYNPENKQIAMSGDARISRDSEINHIPRMQHLTCFTGGMVALGSKIFNRPEEMALAEELTSGCVWAYDNNNNGIGPEIFTVMPCAEDDCTWSEEVWYKHINKANYYEPSKAEDPAIASARNAKRIIKERRLTPGLVSVDDRRYVLRPEAIESVFIMYRTTGDRKWQDTAWRMFQHVEKVTRTEYGAGAISDITVDPDDIKTQQTDSMESFWLAETLKYYYLCFEDFDKVSLDEYVLNTEAHPLKRPT